ncbi:hypothetical protein D9M72_391080 [compost metagenome]
MRCADRAGLLRRPDCFQHRHEGAVPGQRAEQLALAAGRAAGGQEVFQQIGAVERFSALAVGCGNGQPVLGVEEVCPAQCAVDSDGRRGLFVGTQGQGAEEDGAAGRADPDHRGVVAFGRVGTVQIRLHGKDVVGQFRTGDLQPGGHRMRKGIGGYAVHHIGAVQAAFARPA